MGGNYKPYPNYKASGIEWLGDVPEGWGVRKLKNISTMITGTTPPTVSIENYSDKETIYGWIKPENIEEDSKYVTVSNFLTRKGWGIQKIIPKNSILVCCIGTIGKLALTDRHITTNQQVTSIIPKGDFCYYYYLLLAARYELENLSFGNVVKILNNENLGNLFITLPSYLEQQHIANFLDREVGKIEALIAKQERLVELLTEKRQAVISHAVTKGLNPNTPMKPSAIDWLGDVPEHWEVSRLKFHTKQIVDGTHFTPDYLENGIPFLRVTDIQKEEIDLLSVKYISYLQHIDLNKRCNPQEGDILLSKNGTIGKVKIIDWNWRFSIFVSLCLIKLKITLFPSFAKFYFESNQLQTQIVDLIKQSTVINLHLDKIANFIFIIPPLAEQQQIADFLDQETQKIDSLIQKAQQMVVLLKERKIALISAAVTGKIDVRNG